jgi:hypothetical protein
MAVWHPPCFVDGNLQDGMSMVGTQARKILWRQEEEEEEEEETLRSSHRRITKRRAPC